MATVVFMGTPDFAVPTLRGLINHHDVIGVVTQPDRPAGRGGQIRMSPIKTLALEHGIPVFQPEKLRKPDAIAELKQWQPDVYVVAAFGQILPQDVLDIPPHGAINVHASILPRWRGAAPIHAAIRAGDVETGVTIMKMDAGLDTGPILSVGVLQIMPDETGQSLHDKLAELGANLLIQTLPAYLNGLIEPQPQPEIGVTYAPQIKKEDGHIDWTQSALDIERLVRAFTPWPGTYTYWKGKQLKIHAGRYARGAVDAGLVIEHVGQVAIGTGRGLFIPLEVQLEGKKRMDIADFLRGYPDFIGSELK
ncbi:MAG: methionyl-tRNA formyltransferase [Phototrophicales bacterium]|nr:MAG: methionyl-tRNA formyltransferase [Phototrophicales bacterium]RMG73998.1 MAG: methionyl-tRNA formyltransferase [Chloroflexota bacterium]